MNRCNLRDLALSQAPQVGLKAATLGELARAGLPVPPGFCFTTEAYRKVLGPLETQILARASADAISDPIEIERAAEDIRGWIEAAPWPAELMAELGAGIAALDGERVPGAALSFAARTSLTSEELASAFGSGVRRAFLGLVGEVELAGAISRCWATPFTSRSLYYRHRKKIKQTGVDLGVLVHPLLAAQAAGVMFTANPTSGATEEVLIDSTWGLGEPVTSARVRPDRFVLEKETGRVVTELIADKPVRLEATSDGSLVQTTVELSRQDQPSLEPAQLLDLARLARQVETRLGNAQEVEWCLAGGAIYLLQARPIGQRK